MTTESKTLVIYHGNCLDGFCAAWVLWAHKPDADNSLEFFPAEYGKSPPDVAGRDVVMVDFSYPRDVLLEMKRAAKSLIVLDHHKTAEEALRGLDFCVFDMNKSGARLAFDYVKTPGNGYCTYEAKTNWIVDYVEDRDLWRFSYLCSKEVNAAIGSWPQKFPYWLEQLGLGVGKAATEGRAILRFIQQYVDEMSAQARTFTFCGHEILLVNAPYKNTSELVGHLAGSAPFAMGWFQRKDGVFQYSLRSHGDFDVSQIAKQFGGGGHKNAAGFTNNLPPWKLEAAK